MTKKFKYDGKSRPSTKKYKDEYDRIFGKKLTDLTGNSTDFEKAYRKMQGRKAMLGKLGMGSVLGAGGLAGLGAYESLIG